MVNEYKQTRLLMFTLARLLGDPKKPVKSPEAMWPLPGDENTAIKTEEIAGLFERLKKKDG